MLKISIQRYFLAAVVLIASSNAISREISYDYIQGSYLSTTADLGSAFGDVDGDGVGISGSFSVSPKIALTASYGAISYDRLLGVDIDTTALTFGVMAHSSIAERTDIIGGFSLLMGDIELSNGFTTISDDDTGNIISFGFRHMATDVVEFGVSFSRVDIFDDTSNTFEFGARFYTNEKLSFGIAYATGDDVDSLLLNLRIGI